MTKVRQVELTAEEIAAVVENPIEKELTLNILKMFTDNGYTYKTRTQYKPADSLEGDDYRVFCYIKKSKEALIINTKYSHPNKFRLQMRLLNQENFDRLGEYSENLRSQILGAGKPCEKCSCGKGYRFTYEGKAYEKCHMICTGFWLCDFNAEDAKTIVEIVQREIEFSEGRNVRKINLSN